MFISGNINNNSNMKNPAFCAVNYDAAKDTLRKVLSVEELQRFKKSADSYNKIENVDLIFFGENKKLTARIADTTTLIDGRIKDYSRRFYEKPMVFIERMFQKMLARNNEVKEMLYKQNFDL